MRDRAPLVFAACTREGGGVTQRGGATMATNPSARSRGRGSRCWPIVSLALIASCTRECPICPTPSTVSQACEVSACPQIAPPIGVEPKTAARVPAELSSKRCGDSTLKKFLDELSEMCDGGFCRIDRYRATQSIAVRAFADTFAQEDDEGVATYFAVFGCNIYGAGGDCLGYDSYYTDPKNCPEDDAYEWVTRQHGDGPRRHLAAEAAGAQANCRAYSAFIHNGLNAFIDNHLNADRFLFFGVSGATGNLVTTANPVGRQLAGRRAGGLRDELVKRQLESPDMFTGRGVSDVVVLDNRFDDPRFRMLAARHIDIADERQVQAWASSMAMNRVVMVLAVRCPGR